MVEITVGIGVAEKRVPESSLEVSVFTGTHIIINKHTPLANTLLKDVHRYTG